MANNHVSSLEGKTKLRKEQGKHFRQNVLRGGPRPMQLLSTRRVAGPSQRQAAKARTSKS